MHDAEDIIDRASVDGIPRAAGFGDAIRGLFDGQASRKPNDLGPWRHDVRCGLLGELEHTLDHAKVAGVDLPQFLALLEEHDDLFR